MIKQVDITEKIGEENLFTVKIKSNFDCYNKFDFCNTFFQETDGESTAFISILNGDSQVFATEKADFEEIERFLCFQSVKSIFCNSVTAEYFGKDRFESGIILKNSGNYDGEAEYEFCPYPDYKSVYRLVKGEFPLPDYNEFVSDLSFRLKKGFAKVIENEKGTIFSAWETPNCSVISALAVDITERHKGVGTKLLNSFLKGNGKREVYVYCEKEKSKFYQKNGFLTEDSFYFLKGF